MLAQRFGQGFWLLKNCGFKIKGCDRSFSISKTSSPHLESLVLDFSLSLWAQVPSTCKTKPQMKMFSRFFSPFLSQQCSCLPLGTFALDSIQFINNCYIVINLKVLQSTFQKTKRNNCSQKWAVHCWRMVHCLHSCTMRIALFFADCIVFHCISLYCNLLVKPVQGNLLLQRSRRSYGTRHATQRCCTFPHCCSSEPPSFAIFCNVMCWAGWQPRVQCIAMQERWCGGARESVARSASGGQARGCSRGHLPPQQHPGLRCGHRLRGRPPGHIGHPSLDKAAYMWQTKLCYFAKGLAR